MCRNRAILFIALAAFVLGLVVSAIALRLMWPPTPTPQAAVDSTKIPIAAPTASATLTAAPTPSVTPSASPSIPSDVTPSAVASEGQGERLDLPLIQSGQRPTATVKPTRKPTKTPKPTNTPIMPWPEPLAQPGRSKVGLHIQWNNSSEIMEFIRRMKPPAIKAMDDLGFLNEVKELSPTTVTVARFSEESQPMEGDPAQTARDFVARHLEQYLANPAVDYWEGYNEPGINGNMAWYAAFEAERARVMAEHGLKVAVGAFSTGVPEYDDFIAFLPAIQAAKRYNGILTLHEYDAPTMDRSVGAGLPGKPNHADRGALVLRYRWWYRDILIPRGLTIPLVISEAGIDGAGISGHPGPDKGKGWRDFRSYWREQGLGDDSIRVYTNQIAWYDTMVQEDSYVIGFTLFTAGVMNDQWKTYDITEILRHIATWVVVPHS